MSMIDINVMNHDLKDAWSIGPLFMTFISIVTHHMDNTTLLWPDIFTYQSLVARQKFELLAIAIHWQLETK